MEWKLPAGFTILLFNLTNKAKKRKYYASKVRFSEAVGDGKETVASAAD